jgi:hypothetical protein
MKLHPVHPGIFFRVDRIIGAYQGAHGTPDTGIRHIGFLPDPVKYVLCNPLIRLSADAGSQGPLSEHAQFYGFDRTHGCALAAQGTPVIAEFHLPGQVVEA